RGDESPGRVRRFITHELVCRGRRSESPNHGVNGVARSYSESGFLRATPFTPRLRRYLEAAEAYFLSLSSLLFVCFFRNSDNRALTSRAIRALGGGLSSGN